MVDLIYLARNKEVASACKYRNDPSVSIKFGGISGLSKDALIYEEGQELRIYLVKIFVTRKVINRKI